MKKLLVIIAIFGALVLVAADKTDHGTEFHRVRVIQTTAAAVSGDCDAAAELGRVHIQTGDPASVATRVSVCAQIGASSYGWNPVSHKVATTAPATCVTGEVFFDSDATAGSNWFGCTAANTWTALGGGGASGAAYGFYCCPNGGTITASQTIWGMGTYVSGNNASVYLRAELPAPLDTGETCTIGNLRVRTSGSAQAAVNLSGGTLVVAAAINGTASALTCTVADGTSSCSDLSNTAMVSAGDQLSFKFTSGAYSTAPYVQASFDCRR